MKLIFSTKITRSILFLLAIFFIVACSKDEVLPDPADETEGLTLVATFPDSENQVELFTGNGKLLDGYNEIFLRIKKPDGSFISNTPLSWYPEMHMTSMSHSCPFSEISKVAGAQSLYNGYVVFQMAGNESEYWELTVHYSDNGQERSATGRLNVALSDKRRITTFQGTDHARYILALVEPATPEVALNKMTALLFAPDGPSGHDGHHSGHRLAEQGGHTSGFSIVDGYTIKIDPRMPGMDNHSSPNNKDLVQSVPGGIYEGTLSLTMTGYWKINLQVEDTGGHIIKGEPVTEAGEASSIFFEVEF